MTPEETKKGSNSEERTIRMPDTSHLIVSSSPHFHTETDVRKIMLTVIIALLPACAAGVYYFGWRALWVLLVCSASCISFEAIFSCFMKRPSELNDASALVTGLLLGMNLPSSTPLGVCIFGSLVAIGIGKMIYGGIGSNPFNPALVGRVAMLIAFPKVMTTWPIPHGAATSSAITGATPLMVLGSLQHAAQSGQADALQTLGEHVSYMNLYLGNIGGSLGETCIPALLIGGIFLIYMNIIRWQIPVFYILTVFFITGLAYMISPAYFAAPTFHIMSGGLMLGAFFMATDMVTTPASRTGAIIFAVGCGVITGSIRLRGSYPEGVSFSILIMNAFTPLIDRYTAGKPFGAPKDKKRGLQF